jgi:hypothetical protein
MYAFHMDVPQPIEMYDQVRKEVEARIGRPMPEECLVHFVTPTGTGFRITEVWESHEAVDRFGDEVMRPAVAAVAGEEAVAGGPPPNQEFDVHRIVLRGASST